MRGFVRSFKAYPALTLGVVMLVEAMVLFAGFKMFSGPPHSAQASDLAGDEDLVVIIRVNDYEQVARVVTEHVAPLDGLLETRTLVAFRQYDPAGITF